MRSRKTNFLQMVVLLSGIVYIFTGALFAVSPHFFGKVFFLEINEDWFMEIPKDAFMFTSITLARTFAGLLLTIGIAMILPLFDPKKYRGLIYFTNVVFPFLASFLLIKSLLINPLPVLIVYATLFSLIGLCAVIALLLTKGNAKIEQ